MTTSPLGKITWVDNNGKKRELYTAAASAAANSLQESLEEIREALTFYEGNRDVRLEAEKPRRNS